MKCGTLKKRQHKFYKKKQIRQIGQIQRPMDYTELADSLPQLNGRTPLEYNLKNRDI